MSSLLQSLAAQLDGQPVADIAQSLGADPALIEGAVAAALPALVGALADNAAQPSGAAALFNALGAGGHDGSILGQLASSGLLNNLDLGDGAKILGHVLGGQQNDVASQVSGASGLDMNTVLKLLPILAPIVMGMIGKHKNQNSLDADGVAGALQNESKALPGGGGLGGILGSLAQVAGGQAQQPKAVPGDTDGDGDVDITDIGVGILKNQGGVLGSLGKLLGN